MRHSLQFALAQLAILSVSAADSGPLVIRSPREIHGGMTDHDDERRRARAMALAGAREYEAARDEKIAAIYRAERLARKSSNFAKRQPCA